MTTYPLRPVVHATHEELGRATAAAAASTIREAIDRSGGARVMLAAAPSQSPTLTALAQEDVDFSRVTFFHMDDYLGLDRDAPQGFGNWLEREFLDRLPAQATFHRMDPSLRPEEAQRAYTEVLGTEPFDLTLCGLGVNGHLAFNEPGADFQDPQSVRLVDLDVRSRQQQVDEGHFPDVDAVPARALTVTVPRLLNAGHVICSVLGEVKHNAVAETLAKEPTSEVPGTALKLHPHVELHVDKEAAGE